MRNLVERELTSAGPRRTGGAVSGRRSVTVNLAESPLTWLHSRGHLTDRQFDAGERLRTDYERAQLPPSVTMRWDPVRVDNGSCGHGLTESERQIAAKDRFDGAMAGYERAATKVWTSLGWLNFGQAVIFGVGMLIMMWLSASAVQASRSTASKSAADTSGSTLSLAMDRW